MSVPKPQLALKFLPSFTDFAFLMPIAFLFSRMNGVKTLLGDCDTGWHIRTGEWISANHAVPARDIFSFSKPGDPWFAWEWLSDVVFAWINAIGGLRAVALFAILLLSATFTLLYFLTRRRSNPIVAIFLTMLAAATSSIHWLARPHLFTFLFAVLFYAALENVRAGRTRLAGIPYLAIFPFATILWTNLHGGFFVGILMIFAYGGAELFEFFIAPETEQQSVEPASPASGPTPRERARRAARAYFLSAFACLAASLINPYTYHLHAHMLEYLRDPWNSEHIAEFLSPSFHHPTALLFEMLLALAAWSVLSNLRRGRFAEPILLVLWAHAALLACRNIAIFAIFAAPVAGETIQRVLDSSAEWNVAAWARRLAARFNRLADTTANNEAVGRWHLVSALGLAAVVAVIWAPNPPWKFRAEFDPGSYPTKALSVLRGYHSARIFTNDEWGDYLIWSLYPSNRVFVDGRSDFYGDDFETRYYNIVNVRAGWDKTLSRFGIDTILLPLDTPLAGALKESSHWKAVYDDGVSLIFRPSTAQGETLPVTASRDGESRGRETTERGPVSYKPALTKSKS